MQVPMTTSRTLTTPGGLMSTVTESRTATLDDPMNLFSLSEMTEAVTVNGRPYVTTFGAASGRITNRTPSGRERVSLLDARGRLMEAQLPGLSPLRFSYDAVGRLVTIQQGARVASLSYDTLGRVASLSDALSRTAVFEYDTGERLRRQVLPDGREIHYNYDANGNLTSIIPPGRSTHAFAYTAVDLAEFYLPPEIGAGPCFTQYVYNLDRQPVQVRRPDGTTVDLAYDSAGRVSAIASPDGQTTFGYHQDSGHLLTITAPDGGTLTYAYDGSLLTQETWSGSVSGSVQRAYDHDFRLTTQHVNGELAATFQYDVDGLLTAAGALTFERNAMNGLLMGTTIGNVSDIRSYDSFGEGIEYRAIHGGNTVLSMQYRRDLLGRVIEKTETVDGQTNTYGYTYNPAGWLVEIHRNGASGATYTYDSNGNRLSHTSTDGTFAADYDAQDRLIRYGTSSYTYTLNGDLQRKTTGNAMAAYEYDASGNLRVVVLPNGERIEYVIDGRNRRIGKKINGTLIQGFLYDGLLSPVAELDGAGQVTARFIYGTRGHVPDYMIKGGITYRILSDHLGSPRLVIDTATGQIAQRLFYDPFGRVLFDDNPGFQPFGFAGGLYDSDTRLTRFGARDYDADTGRWTAKDPILFAGGDTNLYGYVLNDPVNWVDPLGLEQVRQGIIYNDSGEIVGETGLDAPNPLLDPINLFAGGLSGQLFKGASAKVAEACGLSKGPLERQLPFSNPGLVSRINQTLDNIKKGITQFSRDGTTFKNRENRLPSQPDGYYREFTVQSPNTKTRGPLRIIVGQNGESYFTPNHYRSFTRIEGP
jgi:RHS repeat-associated protein